MRTLLILIFLVALFGQNGISQNYSDVTEAQGVAVGVMAPSFRAIDGDSTYFDLSEALRQSPVVIIFYRGHWCPVCNNHLAHIQDSLSLITDEGVTIVAISPEKPEYLEKMKASSGAKFRLLYDKDYHISDAYDVTFLPEREEILLYNTRLNAQLKQAHSDESQRLPIPATFIIDTNGMIVWRQFNPDYTQRASVKSILNNLP